MIFYFLWSNVTDYYNISRPSVFGFVFVKDEVYCVGY